MKYYQLYRKYLGKDAIVDVGGKTLDISIYPSGHAWTDYMDQFKSRKNYPFIENPPEWLPEPDHTVYNPEVKKFRNEDLLSLISSNVLVINDRTKQIFDNFRKSPNIYNNNFVKHRDDVYNYWIYHFYHHNLDIIDFKKSTFYRMPKIWSNIPKDDRKYFRFINMQECMDNYKNQRSLGYVRSDNIKLIEPTKYDIFSLSWTIMELESIIINHDVYKELKKMPLTNIKFMKCKFLN